jgi:hypothetical protein
MKIQFLGFIPLLIALIIIIKDAFHCEITRQVLLVFAIEGLFIKLNMKIQFLGFIPLLIALIIIIKDAFHCEITRQVLLVFAIEGLFIIGLIWANSAL